jgi:hypothetical protein
LVDSQAQFLLADMAERIHSNNNPAYTIVFAAGTPLAGTDCAAITCTSDALALWDIWQWRSTIENSAWLPEGEGQVVYYPVTGTFVISIRYTWSQLGEAALLGEQRTVSLTVGLRE